MATQRQLSDPSHPAFELEEYPFYVMTTTMGLYYARLDQVLEAVGADQQGWRVLLTLGDQGPCSIGDIARRTVIKMSTMTRIIQRMQKRGLLHCTPRPQDHRVTDVSLTDKGRDALARVKQVAAQVYQQAMRGMDDAALAAFLDTVRHIQANMRDEGATALRP